MENAGRRRKIIRVEQKVGNKGRYNSSNWKRKKMEREVR
jgi:hypothetical protein